MFLLASARTAVLVSPAGRLLGVDDLFDKVHDSCSLLKQNLIVVLEQFFVFLLVVCCYARSMMMLEGRSSMPASPDQRYCKTLVTSASRAALRSEHCCLDET